MANTVEKGLVSKSALTAIGDAIRAKNGSTTKYKPSEMAAAISELKTGDFAVVTSDKFTYKVVQSANQIITSTPVGKAINNQDGTISLVLTDDTTVSPNTNYIPGAISRSYDDNTHTYTVTATDAEPIDGLVQDGWSVVYQKTPAAREFYSKADYTGSYEAGKSLQGNILIGGMQEVSSDKNIYSYPQFAKNITKFKNNFITSAGKSLLTGCSSLISVELPNLASAGDHTLATCSSLTSVELPNLTNTDGSFLTGCSSLTSVKLPKLTSAGNYVLEDCSSLTSIELPKLTSVGSSFLTSCSSLTSVELPKLTTVGVGLLVGAGLSKSSPMYFADLGYITENTSADTFMYTKVIVLRADKVPSSFIQSRLSDPVLYIVPSALVDTYKAKVRSQDYVTALEKSPFADGKTVCGNNMKTKFGNADFSDTPDTSTKVLVYRPNTQTNGSWEYNSMGDVLDDELFSFWSKLTEEQGYTMPLEGSILISPGNTTFTVPDGVRVLESRINDKDLYIGVTPGATYTVNFDMGRGMIYSAKCVADNTEFFYFSMGILEPFETHFYYSTEINAQTPTVTDYH